LCLSSWMAFVDIGASDETRQGEIRCIYIEALRAADRGDDAQLLAFVRSWIIKGALVSHVVKLDIYLTQNHSALSVIQIAHGLIGFFRWRV